MVVFLGRTRAMGWTWLCYHLLLCTLVTFLAITAGERCFSWNSIHKIQYKIFSCPESSDALDMKFCCGTCSEPYCCSSAEDQLDIDHCLSDPDPQDRRTTDTPEVGTDYLSVFSYIMAFIISAVTMLLTSMAISYGFNLWRSRNREQNIPMQRRRSPRSLPSDSIEFIHDSRALQPTSDVQPGVQSGHGNAGFQGEGAQPSPGYQLDSASGTGGPSSTEAYDSGSILSHSDPEESRGTRSQPTPSTGNNLPSDDVPPNSIEDPYDSLGLAASQTLATRQDSSEIVSSAQGDPEVQQVHSSDAPPSCSPTASPSVDPEDSPPCNVAASHDLQVLPRALDSPSEETQHATPRPTEDEFSPMSPSPPPDVAAAGPILDQVDPSQTNEETGGAGSESTRP